MTDRTLLEKIIEKAVRGGYRKGKETVTEIVVDYYGYESHDIEHLIFAHDFAQAFFGPSWRLHLQGMVLHSDPLEYIEKFI